MKGLLISLALIVLLLLLTGCTSQPIYKPVEVKVPVAVPCAAKLPAAPAWPTLAVAPVATMTERTKALAAENELRKGYEVRLRAAIAGCNQ